jgi:hypothetical protein
MYLLYCTGTDTSHNTAEKEEGFRNGSVTNVNRSRSGSERIQTLTGIKPTVRIFDAVVH